MPRKLKKYNEYIELGKDANGKRIRKWIRADKKSEFDALRREAEREFESIRNPSTVTIGAYATTWFETYKATKALQTREMYNNAIKHLDGIKNRQLKDLTSTDLQKIITKNWEHPRICEILKLTLKQIYAQAIKDGIIYPINLADDLDIPKAKHERVRFFSDEELETILSLDFSVQDRLYVDVLRYTGMRPAEALALMYEDISDDVIHVSRSFEFEGSQVKNKGTKTEVCRDIPLSNSLRSALLCEGKTGYIFVRKDGSPYTKSSYTKMFYRIIGRIRKAIGDDTIVMYTFRHTFATQLYYHGCRPGIISTKKAAQIMGHSEKVFLDRYTHIDDSKESAASVIEMIYKPERIFTVSSPSLVKKTYLRRIFTNKIG